MDGESKPLMAFTVGPLGFYECKRMYFGLPNAPGDFNLHWCIICLNDIVIFSKDQASHLERLEAVFWKLEEAGLKLKPSKCEMFWQQLAYLGDMISAQGIATDEGKIKVIKNWPTPMNITEVRSFLGFMGYYCWFIPKFSWVAWPLHELTSGENAGKKKAAINWDSRCQQAFMTWRDSAPWHLFLHMQSSSSLSSFILMLVALAWELSSIRPERMALRQE